MTDHSQILLQHGWGFDKNIWDTWVEFYPEYDFIIPDRGYYGKPVQVEYSGITRAVTHSFGLHLLPAKLFNQLDVLVIIAGFQEFHPIDKIQRKLSQRIIRQMLNKLKDDPVSVLDQFIQNTYKPETVEFKSPEFIDAQLLHDDLQILNTHKLNLKPLDRISKVIILHGDDDKVVPLSNAIGLHKKLSLSSIFIKKNSGHMLQISDTSWCLVHIKEVFYQRSF
ncbi:MAG: alpha/beta hydrolase [Balneolales bacterium]